MHLNKRIFAISAISALLLPQLCLAAASADDKQVNYNITLLCLVGLIVILLFVIGMLGGTLRQLSFVVKERNYREKKEQQEKQQSSGTGKTVMMLLLFLFSAAGAFAATTPEATAPPSPEFISGIPIMDFYFIVCMLALELCVIFALTFYIHQLLKVIRKEDLEVTAKVARKSWFWDKLNSASTIEKEKDIMLDHDYDGIHELDNNLPPWWKYGFYLTIVVGVIYIYRFHVSHEGMSQEQEFVEEMQKGEEAKAAYLAQSANNVDESNVVQLTGGGDVAEGKEIFTKNCAPCHLADGGGSVGPNLTDDYWLHGGAVKDIFKSIKYGWQDKGMKSWKDDLSPKQIQLLASFIKSLKGTHPVTPKAPQGDLYIEAAPTAKSDSAAKVLAEVRK